MSTISSSTTSTTAYKVTADTTGTLVLQTGATPTTAVTIDTSQNVGIGTASPTQKLQVHGSSGADVYTRISNTDSTTSSGLLIGLNGNEEGIVRVETNQALIFGTNNTERMRILASGNILSLSGGSTTATGTGIAFPATQSASSDVNTLDDYEEGTWTPVITGTSTAGSATYSTQSGAYVKIGRYVFLQMFVVFTSAHTGTGGTKVGNFPFTISSGFGNGGTITYKTAWVTNGPDFMQGEQTTTFGYLRYDTNTGQADITPNVNIQNTTGFMLSIWYLSDN